MMFQNKLKKKSIRKYRPSIQYDTNVSGTYCTNVLKKLFNTLDEAIAYGLKIAETEMAKTSKFLDFRTGKYRRDNIMGFEVFASWEYKDGEESN